MLNQGRYPLQYVGTCLGTYICNPSSYMGSTKNRNIYSFSGAKTPEESVNDRENATSKEKLFANYIILGDKPEEAYIKAFETKSKQYAKIKAFKLLKTERVMSSIKEQTEDTMKALSIDAEYLLGTAKIIVDDVDANVRDRLTALQMLWKAAGIGQEQKQTTTVQGAFLGFTENDKQLIEKKVEKLGDGS
tara:strand:+ start:2870 stop:3439 length:570 start_codon:yes stop_codon:yes gene_type:complete